MTDKDEIRNLRQRVKKLTAEAKRQKERADEAEYYLTLVDAQLAFVNRCLPVQVRMSERPH
jgi:hypothetical protein